MGPLQKQRAREQELQRCRRQLRQRRPLEVAAEYKHGVSALLSYQREPADAWRPFAKRVRHSWASESRR